MLAGDEDWQGDSNYTADNYGEDNENYPFVTVQLPIFNEKYVIARLIDAVAKFDYPKDRFEIHIIDDLY